MTPSRRTLEAMTLGGMALDNRTITVRCSSCRRTRVFLTRDLARVYGERQSPHYLFRSCSKCGAPVRVSFGFPHRGEKICRPVPHASWKWRELAYEPDADGAE